MGRRGGPPPTPTAILKARGSWRAKIRPGEPQPGRGAPRLPVWLMPAAKKIWKRLAPQLEAMGVLSTIDGDALARYCQTMARWRRAMAVIADQGETYETLTTAGHPAIKARPEVGIVGKLVTDLARLEGQFGMTPSSRTSLNVIAIFTPGRNAAPTDAKAPTIIEGKDRFFNR